VANPLGVISIEIDHCASLRIERKAIPFFSILYWIAISLSDKNLSLLTISFRRYRSLASALLSAVILPVRLLA